jgi:hypothetical protein
MGKSFVSVSVPSELSAVFVSEFDNGAIGFAESNTTHYTLIKNYTGLPVAGRVLPQAGAPIAGSPNAVWNPSL